MGPRPTSPPSRPPWPGNRPASSTTSATCSAGTAASTPRPARHREDRHRILQGLTALGLDHSNLPVDQDDQPGATHPDPAATRLASDLELRLRPLGASVLLIGSRARGDHRPDSDIDLLISLPESRENSHPDKDFHLLRKVRTTARRFLIASTPRLRRKGVHTDAKIPPQWNKTLWTHHSDKLVQGQPNGLAFTNDRSSLESLPISFASQGPTQQGLPFYFLTDGAYLFEVSTFDCVRMDALDLPRCK